MVIKYKNKVKLQVWIDEKIYSKLLKLVKEKHENLRGALSAEVEEALRFWLEVHTQNHAKPVTTRSSNRVELVFSQVMGVLKEKYKFIPVEVSERVLVHAISIVRGSDPRTIRKWIKVFEEHGLIEESKRGIYRIKQKA